MYCIVGVWLAALAKIDSKSTLGSLRASIFVTVVVDVEGGAPPKDTSLISSRLNKDPTQPSPYRSVINLLAAEPSGIAAKTSSIVAKVSFLCSGLAKKSHRLG